jgi:hypothetical protein
VVKDLKEGLSSARKADVTQARGGIKRYLSRACEYGNAKYARANFLRPTVEGGKRGGGGAVEQTRADFERFRSYLRAASSHLDAVLDSMEYHQAIDNELVDADGMRRAAYAEDEDAKPGCPIGASGLPHVAHAVASLMMAIEQATLYGLLPHDPGQPWVARTVTTTESDEVPASWRRRHEANQCVVCSAPRWPLCTWYYACPTPCWYRLDTLTQNQIITACRDADCSARTS